MEIVIQILILFIIINSILKLSFWRWWQAMFRRYSSHFVPGTTYAITQSKTQLQDYFQNRRAMQDMAVLITVESAIGLGFCFAALMNGFGKRKRSWMHFLHGYPGTVAVSGLVLSSDPRQFSACQGTDFHDCLCHCRNHFPCDSFGCIRHKMADTGKNAVRSPLSCKLVCSHSGIADHRKRKYYLARQ